MFESDTSHYIAVMGRWTWAELTTGTLVGCLPVMPKFFRHFGSKIYMTLLANNKITSEGGRGFNIKAPKDSRSLVTLGRPLNDDAGNKSFESNTASKSDGSIDHQAHYVNEHYVLDGVEASSCNTATMSDPLSTTGGGIVTHKEDLETGRHQLRDKARHF